MRYCYICAAPGFTQLSHKLPFCNCCYARYIAPFHVPAVPSSPNEPEDFTYYPPGSVWHVP